MVPLYQRLSPTKDLKGLAYAVGSKLQEKTKVPTEEKETELFSYKWTKECGTLLKQLSEATVCMKRPFCNRIAKYERWTKSSWRLGRGEGKSGNHGPTRPLMVQDYGAL